MAFGLALVCTLAWAQDRTVSGTVSSGEDGDVLIGVNVILKGTTTGTISDIDGNYSLSVPSDGGTLVFSFIGFATQEVAIGASSVVDLTLMADVTQLGEIVVTALGIEREEKIAIIIAGGRLAANGRKQPSTAIFHSPSPNRLDSIDR